MNGKKIYTEGIEKSNRPLTGFDSLDVQDFILARWRLVQLQSSDIPGAELNLGKWYNTLTGEMVDELHIAPVDVAIKRVCWPEKYNPDDEPLCKADNGIRPNDDGQALALWDAFFKDGIPDVEITCANCPLATFGPAGEKPLCTKQFVYHVLDADGQEAIMRLQRTSASVAKQINSASKRFDFGLWLILKGKIERSRKGTYAICDMTLGDPLSDPLRAKVDRLQRAVSVLGNIKADETENPHAQANAEDEDASPFDDWAEDEMSTGFAEPDEDAKIRKDLKDAAINDILADHEATQAQRKKKSRTR